MDHSEVIQRLQGVVSDEFKWPEVPQGWRLEFIAYAKNDVILDLLHPVANKFWSEDNGPFVTPFLKDGSAITVQVLQVADIPFMTTFGTARCSMEKPSRHLSIRRMDRDDL